MARKVEGTVRSALPLVELRDATVSLNGRRLFLRTSWAILPGEHWAILGPNGSGKSILARALWGDVPVLDGLVLYPLAGLDSHAGGWPEGFSPERYVRHVCFADQQDLVARHSHYLQGRYESLEGDDAPTAAEVLGLPRPETARGGGGSAMAPALVDQLGIREIFGRRVLHLSNGEMRKLLIVKALLGSPRLLILEEPLQGLDRESHRELSRLLSRVARLGVTIVVVTSRRRDVLPLVRRVLCVRDGKVVGRGRRGDLAPGGRLGMLVAPGPAPTRSTPLPTPAVRPARGDFLVELKDVTVSYGGVRILDRVSWTIREGENWALVGPNGSGKTMLLSMILADNPQAYANDVRVFGHSRGDGSSIQEIKSRLGHVSPEALIHHPPAVTVLEAICSGFFDSVGLYQTCSIRLLRKAKAWARAMDLGAVLEKPLLSLSDGEKRLVLVARALVKSPRLLVLDEPCQGLDDAHAEKVIQVVDGLGRRGALSLIYVTHEPREVPPCISHLLRLRRGRVASAGKRRR